ncbi:MAG TPA: polysaccharide biosynthesis/export family protein [Terracidiphilus sp.]|jgi:polysaccharide export outer membrane protein
MNWRNFKTVVVLLFAGLVPPHIAPAQTAPASTIAEDRAHDPISQPPDPQLKPNPLIALRRFEPDVDEEYRLGRGDEINLDFSGRPEMQAKIIIGPDGRITLPLAGEIKMSGLTRSEGAQAVESALSPFYANLAIQITVTRYVANRILLLGAVEHPGALTFEGTPTLLEAITRGGLPLTGPNKLPQIPDRCGIYRGSDQVMWVDLKTLIESGNPLADLRLRRDDVIYVPNMAERFVSVLGEVQHAGAIPLTTNSTLPGVIAMAGGTTERAGNNPHVQVVDPAAGTSRVVSMKELLNPAKSLEITLRPGEIIYVPQSGVYRATYLLERLSPLMSLATMAIVDGRL